MNTLPDDDPPGELPDASGEDPADDDEYELEAPVERPQLDVEQYMEAAARPRVVEAPQLPPPPAAPLWQGVFTFPWYRESLSAWVTLSLAYTAFGFFLWMMLGPGAAIGIMAFRALAPATVVLLVLSSSYAAACSLRVIEGTATGWDAIEEWPDMDWRDWAVSLGSMLVLLAQTGLVGFVVSMLPFVGGWPLGMLITLVLFPPLLLSALEADTLVLPISQPVLQSLREGWPTWLTFYAVAGGLLLAWLLVTAAVTAILAPLAPFVAGPLLAAVVLIVARLLGRVALVVGEGEEGVMNDE